MKLNNLTIKEIDKYLDDNEVTEQIITKLKTDSRKGVRQLAQKYINIKRKKQQKLKEWKQKNQKQLELHKSGYDMIAGIDEAGRGPLAGPVVAAAVILNSDKKIIGLNDSKKLNSNVRDELFNIIKEKAVDIGTGVVENEVIDQINIYNATFLAMKRAVNALNSVPDFLLVDGNQIISSLDIEQESIIGGDNKINAIAAASIIAKVTRDRILEEYDLQYPEYGFKKNKGYCTKKHIAALKKYGPTSIHRYSFAIVKKCDNRGFTRQSLF